WLRDDHRLSSRRPRRARRTLCLPLRWHADGQCRRYDGHLRPGDRPGAAARLHRAHRGARARAPLRPADARRLTPSSNESGHHRHPDGDENDARDHEPLRVTSMAEIANTALRYFLVFVGVTAAWAGVSFIGAVAAGAAGVAAADGQLSIAGAVIASPRRLSRAR